MRISRSQSINSQFLGIHRTWNIERTISLVLLRPPALTGTLSGSLIVFAAWYSFIEPATECETLSKISPCRVGRPISHVSYSKFGLFPRMHANPPNIFARLLAVLSFGLLTSGTSFSLLLSLAGNCMTSVFNLCSAASPDTGLDSTVGLSLAETHGATPGSGGSRLTLPYMPAIS